MFKILAITIFSRVKYLTDQVCFDFNRWVILVAEDFEQTGFLFGSNSVFIEELYQQYLKEPSSIDPSWIDFFEGQNDFVPLKSTSKIIIKDLPKTQEYKTVIPSGTLSENSLRAKFMIMAYREHGHYLANLDPLALEVKKTHAELTEMK